MAEHSEARHDGTPWYRTYIVVWVWLLVITVIEIAAVQVGLARLLLIGVLMSLSLLKAALIAGYFMHLRYERLNLVLLVLIPLILAVILFTGVVPDAITAPQLRR
jgi:cytochrome c oxidase subunit 4